ncbi:polysaccharide pyruvyl transferase family protein [uncultured Lacinutrix sp.]|uniref:polysaccharide pyruvyl transferase family protein n=1 Tax=uncultured Lacinutrix sp. TaxID=574032 RepID=UPI002616BADE|nr:polysaccharide pyruvyl transferase family protein [uncultured Lacinutrix sp.]
MSGNRKIVHFLSASDRINYGDLLFPIIFKKVIKQEEIDFYNYGIIKSDLSHFGGIPTMSYKKLQSNTKKYGGTVIIGGGEVFFATWKLLYSYINSFYSKLVKSAFFNRVDGKLKITNALLMKEKVLLPFSPLPSEINNADVLYNAVGGAFFGSKESDYNKAIIKRLNASKYISVRDKRTSDSLKKYGVKSKVSPDSALIMSDYFPTKELENLISIVKTNLPKKYVFIQMGKGKSPKDFLSFSKELEIQLKKTNLEAILCPIGLASLHEDDVELKKLEKFSDIFHLVYPKNIYDIMYLIAESDCYLGTSLHGLITAQSYNKPFIPLNKKIRKTDYYCKTWAEKVSSGCLDYNEIEKLSELIINWDFKGMNNKTVEQKKMVYNNFNLMFSKL